jgi:hypothetical protein
MVDAAPNGPAVHLVVIRDLSDNLWTEVERGAHPSGLGSCHVFNSHICFDVFKVFGDHTRFLVCVR